MEMPDWSKWLSGLLMVLLLLVSGWLVLRWLDIRAADWVMGENKPLQSQFQILSAEEDSVRGSWLRTLNPAMKDVQGGLVWNSGAQQGVMQLLNLPDPQRGFRYHLWIYDSRGSIDAPVSGGVLQEGSGKYEQFIAITPADPVVEPYKFELMLEPLNGDDEAAQVVLMVQP